MYQSEAVCYISRRLSVIFAWEGYQNERRRNATDFCKFTIITGNYGCGKTNLAVNIALHLRKNGKNVKNVAVIDLDTVNPYFRTADFAGIFAENGIRLITPPFANTNVDLPIITAEVNSAFNSRHDHVIFDVGGDDAGATILGRFNRQFKQADSLDILYLINIFRPDTRTIDNNLEMLYNIQANARLICTRFVNNSNIASETSAQNIIDSVEFCAEFQKKSGLPIAFTTVPTELIGEVIGKLPENHPIFPVQTFVKPPWDSI